ncbi:MAG TPA: TetR family transcriptional regulator [Acidimicrobiales bacterium]|jgi:AcrR family transcriptional regulator|nr:TetR family transcriptional regulator [Acidimicrobiales bacterium]
MAGGVKPTPTLSLSDIVERTGVPASTIHHYRRSELIPPPVRQSANRFLYDERHVEAILALRAQPAADQQDCRARIVAAAIEAFKTRSYAEVSMNDIAEASGMAKGNVYRYFTSKETLLTEAIQTLLDETTDKFQSVLDDLGGIDGLTAEPEKSALLFGYVVADVLPMLLELGARAAKGHEPSAELARRVLRTLAATAGRPFIADDLDGEGDEAIQAGLRVIENAFSTVLTWSVGTDWPPDHVK